VKEESALSAIKITYDGDQHATALKEPQHNIVAIDCPYTGKGDEFSPASLFGISLASCMLLSMGAIAQRDHVDIRGTVVDVAVKGMSKTFPHIDTIEIAFNIPRDFPLTEREKLERAADICPIMGCIDAATQVTVTYEYAEEMAA
jgi:uncharacterized OsmC-like protein